MILVCFYTSRYHSSYDAHFIGDDTDGGSDTNQQLPSPPPSSYHFSLIRANNDGRDVHANQHLLPSPPPSYHENDDNMSVQVNLLQQITQLITTSVIRQNEILPQFEEPYILDGSDTP